MWESELKSLFLFLAFGQIDLLLSSLWSIWTKVCFQFPLDRQHCQASNLRCYWLIFFVSFLNLFRSFYLSHDEFFHSNDISEWCVTLCLSRIPIRWYVKCRLVKRTIKCMLKQRKMDAVTHKMFKLLSLLWYWPISPLHLCFIL